MGAIKNLARLDQRHVWHPFTQMRDWLRREPIVIVSGRGATLRDDRGREYLDANASIWTNLHGHNHPRINAAITGQLKNCSFLRARSRQQTRLVARGKLVRAANPPFVPPARRLAKVFYSDDGSTAMEAALKMAYEGFPAAPAARALEFLSLDAAYHGDTIGAVSLGHIDLFHRAYSGLLFKSDRVMSPYCYRCPFNRAKPERADAREYRRCKWECVDQVERKFNRAEKTRQPFRRVRRPGLTIQGAAGMIPQPEGWLGRVAPIARAHESLLIADEILTGFGRAGGDWLFASHREGVQPDLMALAKGMSGGYLPMAATLASQNIFDAFLGEYDEFKTFFHGHSYTANQLGAAASLASLEILQSPASLRQRRALEQCLRSELASLWQSPLVGDIRQVGLIAGIELVKNWRTREAFPLDQRVGIRVCEALARRGVLTRPIGNVIVIMPPYSATAGQIRAHHCAALRAA